MSAKTQSLSIINTFISETVPEKVEDLGDDLKILFFEEFGKTLTDDDFVDIGMVMRFMSPADIHHMLLK